MYEPNWFTGGAIIGPNVHTCSPLFLPHVYQFTLKYLAKYIFPEGEQKFPEVYRPYFTHIHTSITKCMHAISCQINMNVCSVFHSLQKSCHKMLSPMHHSVVGFPS